MARNICKDKAELDRLLFEINRKAFDKGNIDKCDFPKELQKYSDFSSIPDELRDKMANLDNMRLLHNVLLFIVFEHHEKYFGKEDGKTIYEKEGINLYSNGLGDEFYDYSSHGGIEGFQQLPTGEVFYAFESHLDCELEIDIIIYAEDGILKMYAPERGNCYNARYMCLLGAEDDRKID